MADRVTYYYLTCACGHKRYIATSRWLHRDDLVRRAVCSACRLRQTTDVIVIAESSGGFISGIKPELVGLVVQKV